VQCFILIKKIHNIFGEGAFLPYLYHLRRLDLRSFGIKRLSPILKVLNSFPLKVQWNSRPLRI